MEIKCENQLSDLLGIISSNFRIIEKGSTESRVLKEVFGIKKVIFNIPATVVLWKDGTKTVVKSGDYDVFDPEKGLAMAIAKKALGNKGSYYDIFKEWIPEEIERVSRIKASALVCNNKGMFSSAVDFGDIDDISKEKAEDIANRIIDKLAINNPGILQSDEVTKSVTKTVTLSPEELAERVGVSKATIQRRCRNGEYPGACKVGGKWYIPQVEKVNEEEN